MRIFYVFCCLMLFSQKVFADCRGCCSGHNGVTCINGITQCGDGSPLTLTCQNKKCNKCPALPTIKESQQNYDTLEKPESLLKEKTISTVVHNRFSYSETTRNQLLNIYKNNLKEFYCGCKFNEDKQIDTETCGFTYYKEDNDTNRISWDHIVPQSIIKNTTEDSSPPIGDLHNIVPAVGKINNIRSNYNFSEIPGENSRFGPCDVEVENSLTEPPDYVRGDIARIYFYMESKYNIKISDAERELFVKWDLTDPPDEWECKKNKLVSEIQGNINTFVSNKCLETKTSRASTSIENIQTPQEHTVDTSNLQKE